MNRAKNDKPQNYLPLTKSSNHQQIGKGLSHNQICINLLFGDADKGVLFPSPEGVGGDSHGGGPATRNARGKGPVRLSLC